MYKDEKDLLEAKIKQLEKQIKQLEHEIDFQTIVNGSLEYELEQCKKGNN